MQTVTLDSSALTVGQRIQQLELQGYVVMPDMLTPQQIDELRVEMRKLPTRAVSYSDAQQYVHDIQWLDCPHVWELAVLPAMLAFLDTLFGDALICTGCSYARTEPGYPGMALHTDSQPYGSAIFGMQSSAPNLVRVLYYLDDLTPDRAPLKVIPYSHVCLHADANPYRRYKAHPEEVIVCCTAGSAVIINQKIFHAVCPNRSSQSREVCAVSYRPAWAGPVQDVADHDPERLARLPAHVRTLFGSLNTRHVDFFVKNVSHDMPDDAPRLGRSRWSDGPRTR